MNNQQNQRSSGSQSGEGQVQTQSQDRQSPISDLAFDWVSVMHAKGEGLAAYQKYIEDARKENSQECIELFQRLYEDDARHVEEIKEHLHMVMFDKQKMKH